MSLYINNAQYWRSIVLIRVLFIGGILDGNWPNESSLHDFMIHLRQAQKLHPRIPSFSMRPTLPSDKLLISGRN